MESPELNCGSDISVDDHSSLLSSECYSPTATDTEYPLTKSPLEPYVRRKTTSDSTSRPRSKRKVRDTDDPEQRVKINSRERKRMHDLNNAVDALKAVMPYCEGPSVRKVSKIGTLMLARNHIMSLTNSIAQMQLLVNQLSGGSINKLISQCPPIGSEPAGPSIQSFTAQFPNSHIPVTTALASPMFPLSFSPMATPFSHQNLPMIEMPLHRHGMLCGCVLCTIDSSSFLKSGLHFPSLRKFQNSPTCRASASL